MVEEALVELQRRARAREQADLVAGTEQFRDAIYEDPRDPVAGPADAELTIVEFFRLSLPLLHPDQ